MSTKAEKSAARIRNVNLSKTIADKTADAYSFGRYTNWRALVLLLLQRGYSAEEVEVMVRSKWTRWAADVANKNEDATAQDFARFIDDRTGMFKSARDFRRQLDALVLESTEA